MSEPAVAEEQPERQPSVKVREACERCKRVAVKHSRRAYTWRCSHCGFVNIGPGYREQDKTPPEGTRRRVARRELAAERRSERGSGDATKPAGTPAPAPVRRKARAAGAAPATAPTQGPEDAPRGSTPRPTARPSAAAPARRGFLDRVLYGEGDE